MFMYIIYTINAHTRLKPSLLVKHCTPFTERQPHPSGL